MSKIPKLAIVGRPNVGKSALFNRICKKKIAIVDEAEGVTRDRLYADAELFGLKFRVIDTGGIDARSQALFNDEVKKQAEIAIEEADALIMVVDANIGITELDKEIARILLKTKKPLCLAVNKVDNRNNMHLIYDFASLGINKKIAVSTTQDFQIAELLESVFEGFPRDEQVEDLPGAIKIAVVGRPNVGKSSLINYILDDQRCIVSPIPGTTRDSVDISFEHEGKTFTLIDTAGIRRKHAEHDVVEKFAAIRTQRAIERADICLLILDAERGLTLQDKKIANMIEEAGKGCVILFNKWDLVKGYRMEHCMKGVDEEAQFLQHCPKAFISAKTGRNINQIFGIVEKVSADSLKRITTHQLNKFLITSQQKNHPPMVQGKRLRIYYMAQVDVQPPTFVLFVNYINLMSESYRKYLFNQFRESYGFLGLPIRLYLKGKAKKTAEERMEEGAEKKKRASTRDQRENEDENETSDSFDDEDFDESEEWLEE